MRPLSWQMFCAVVVGGGVGLLCGREAAAQSFGGDVPSLAPSPGTQTQTTPIVPLFSPAVPSVMGDPTGGLGGTTSSNNILNNPLAAPLLYNSMLSASMPRAASTATTSTSTSSSTSTSAAAAQSGMGGGMFGMGATQMGMLMLLNSQQNGGMGGGSLGGASGGQRSAASPGTQPAATSKKRGQSRPGGLASRYFNRTGGHSAYPQNYFNRRPRYFP